MLPVVPKSTNEDLRQRQCAKHNCFERILGSKCLVFKTFLFHHLNIIMHSLNTSSFSIWKLCFQKTTQRIILFVAIAVCVCQKSFNVEDYETLSGFNKDTCNTELCNASKGYNVEYVKSINVDVKMLLNLLREMCACFVHLSIKTNAIEEIEEI